LVISGSELDLRLRLILSDEKSGIRITAPSRGIVAREGWAERHVLCTITHHQSLITPFKKNAWTGGGPTLAVGVFVVFFSGLLGIGGGSAWCRCLLHLRREGLPAQYTSSPRSRHVLRGDHVYRDFERALHHRHKAVDWAARAAGSRRRPTRGRAAAGAAARRAALAIVFTPSSTEPPTLMLIERWAQPKREPSGSAACGRWVRRRLFSTLTATGGAAMVVRSRAP
jgi:hypothetical protein